MESKLNWANYPLTRIAIPFVMGIASACACIDWLELSILFCICGAILSALFLIRKKITTGEHSPIFGVGACLLSFFIGATLYTHQYRSIERGANPSRHFCEGTLEAPPEDKPRSWALRIKQADGTEMLLYVASRGKAKNEDSAKIASLNIGDTILARVKHLNITNRDTSQYKDYNAYLFRNGVCATAYVRSGDWSARENTSNSYTLSSIIDKLHRLQDKLHIIYEEHGISGDAGDVIEAMTIGRKTELSDDVRQNYADSGVSHVLAMSGFHIATILVLLQFLLLCRFIPIRWRWTANLSIILILWCFAAIAGASPSLIRATIMCSILLVCQSFTHQILSINSVTIALMIMLCYNPMNILNIGMQLSFVSVIGIALYAKDFSAIFKVKNKVVQYLWQLIVISFICSTLTAPLVAYHFGSFSILSIATNLAVTLLVTAIIFACAVWWATIWLPTVCSAITALLIWCTDFMNAIVEQMASLPFSVIHWRPGVIAVTLCYVAVLGAFHVILKISRRA